MRAITVLSGGVGGARFLQGLLHGIRRGIDGPLAGLAQLPEEGGEDPAEVAVTVVANTADDLWVHGLKVCPDLDTVMYTLGGGIDGERGWGRIEETFHARDELAAYGAEPTWFGLGDKDLATHLVRTQMLDAGYRLTEVTEALCQRWQPGVRLLPMTDDRVETHVAIDDVDSPSGQRVVHFQEYWVRLRAEVPARAVVPIGMDDARATSEVIAAITDADVVLVPPSNPVVSIGTIASVPGVREALTSTAAPVVGISPIIGASHVHGMARQLLTALGVDVSATGVAGHYAARARGGLIDAWLIADSDRAQLSAIRDLGLRAEAVPLLMTDPEATAALAGAALRLATAGHS